MGCCVPRVDCIAALPDTFTTLALCLIGHYALWSASQERERPEVLATLRSLTLPARLSPPGDAGGNGLGGELRPDGRPGIQALGSRNTRGFCDEAIASGPG